MELKIRWKGLERLKNELLAVSASLKRLAYNRVIAASAINSSPHDANKRFGAKAEKYHYWLKKSGWK